MFAIVVDPIVGICLKAPMRDRQIRQTRESLGEWHPILRKDTFRAAEFGQNKFAPISLLDK